MADIIYDAVGVTEFDGTSGDVVEVEHDAAYGVPEGTVAFSFTAADTNGRQGLFTKDASGYAGGGNHFVMFLDKSTLKARFQDGANEVYLTYSGITPGQEYEVAVTFGPAGVELWIDGALVASDPLVMDWTLNVEVMQWGGRGWGSESGATGFDAPFEGAIADARIYSGVLTPEQIADLAATSSADNAPPVPGDDSVGTDEDVALVIPAADLLANDTDPDGGTPVILGIASQPGHGSASYDPVSDTVTYTPEGDFQGDDSFTVTIGDGAGGTAESTVSVTVAPVNDAPVAADDAGGTVVLGGSVVIDVLGNDGDVDGDVLAVTGVTDGALGTVTNNGDGTVTYTPVSGTGDDSFTYTMGDGALSDTATVTVTVLSEPNTPPVAGDDDYSVDEDTMLSVAASGILTNDTDANGDALSVTLVSGVSHGELVLTGDGSFSYTPDADFSGTDSFEYEVADGNGGTDTGTVTLTVAPVNDTPAAADDTVQTGEDETVVIDVLGNDGDVDGDPLSVTLDSGPSNGSATVNPDGTITYDPDPGFTGSDQFTYAVDDGNGETDTANVRVKVTGSVGIIYDAVGVTEFDGTSGDVVEVEHDAAYGVPEGTVAFSFTAADTNGRQGLFTKDASGYAGGGNHFVMFLDKSTLKARFQDGANEVYLTYSGITPGQEYEVAVTFGPAGVELWIDGALVASDPLVMDWTLNVEVMQWGGRGWGSESGATGFDAPFEGAIADARIYSGVLTPEQIADLAATSSADNAPPVPGDDSVGTDEDVALVIPAADLLANDTDPDGGTPVILGIASQPGHGSASYDPVSDTVTYTPEGDFQGDDSFTVTIGDGAGGTAESTVSVTVAPVNDAPVAADDAGGTVVLGGSVVIDVLGNDGDVDGDVLAVTGVTDGALGTVTNNGDGTVTYTPVSGTGDDSFTYTMGDGALSDTATVTVTVLSEPNTPPVAGDDDYSVDEDTMLSVAASGILTNDTDANGDALSVTLVSGVSHGELVLTGDGSFSYTPDADFSGTDSFEYEVADGNGGTDTGTVTLTVAPVNDTPAAADDTVQTGEDETVVIDVLGNDGDVDGDPLSVTLDSGPSNGSATVNPDGTITYDPDPGFTGSDQFTYAVDDGNGETDTANVRVTG
ncbi:Ig-like domain-containing protein, partial [Pseudoruegeria sp. HB172150]|uniref:Ig-like domain-containing protein n=1 Tax=Pseudoruegeria sp. HB172150 TaxID=2721164 RepID=UPI0015538F7F